MSYKYRAYTADRKIVRGTLEVATEALAEGALYQAGYRHVISLKEASAGWSAEKLLPTLFGVRTQDVIDFSLQLATLLDSGMAIITALRLLEGQARPALKRVISGMAGAIQGGSSLSGTLGSFPAVFPDTYRQVVRAGEQAGKLELGLRQAAGYMERQAATAQRLQRAVAYPVFVLLMAAGVAALLITVALPPLAALFDSLGAALPATTRLLIGVAGFVNAYPLHLLGGLAFLASAAALLWRMPGGRQAWDGLLLRAPVIGAVNTERHVQHLCQTTAMLLQAGLHLPQAMEITAPTLSNRAVRRAWQGARARLIQGEGLAQPLAGEPLFPPLLAEMVLVGEKSGTMDATLATLGDFYQRRVERRLDGLIAMIEPALTLAIGLVVIFIALSMITPLYAILRSIN